jgi:hypothetical protein
MTKKEIVKRQKEIKVRLTEAEHQALLERMTGGELATWIRQTCLEEKPNKKNYKVADPTFSRTWAYWWKPQSNC